MISLQDTQVDVFKIFNIRRVVRIALHQDQFRIDRQDRIDRTLHIGEI